MGLVARDVMERHVISLSPDDPLGNVQRLFSEEGIHGAPVLDDTGRVLGVVSSLDLLRAAADTRAESDAAASRYLSELLEYSPGAWVLDEGAVASDLRVADVMTEGAVSVEADAPIAEVARTLRERRVHRVLVIEGGRLCGIISSFDLVALLEGERT